MHIDLHDQIHIHYKTSVTTNKIRGHFFGHFFQCFRYSDFFYLGSHKNFFFFCLQIIYFFKWNAKNSSSVFNPQSFMIICALLTDHKKKEKLSDCFIPSTAHRTKEQCRCSDRRTKIIYRRNSYVSYDQNFCLRKYFPDIPGCFNPTRKCNINNGYIKNVHCLYFFQKLTSFFITFKLQFLICMMSSQFPELLIHVISFFFIRVKNHSKYHSFFFLFVINGTTTFLTAFSSPVYAI